MRSLTLTAALGLLLATTACSSDRTEAERSPAVTPSSATGSAGRAPAVTLADHPGAVTYCSEADPGRGATDYVWSGVQLRTHDEATLERIEARASGVRIVGSWVLRDARDDGLLAPWGHGDRAGYISGLTPAEGARLAGDTTYRLVLRLRPEHGSQTQIDRIGVDWSGGGGSGSLVDRATLRFGGPCT